MENEMKIEEYHKTELEPVEITEGYDAGWLSPDGDFYGLNGSTENLLHLNIAEWLLASKKIPVKEMRNPDRWLEENGWVKVHHDWILFSGSFYGKLSPKPRSKSYIAMDKYVIGAYYVSEQHKHK